MTQWLSLVRNPARHAFDNPTLFVAGYWSLNYEEQFYIVMGVLMFTATFFKKSMLPAILAIMVPAFFWNLRHQPLSHGVFWEYWVAFGFGTMVFFRLCKLQSLHQRNLIDLVIFIALAFSVRGLLVSTNDGSRWLYCEWIVTSGFALLLIVLRHWDEKYKASRLGIILSSLGLISYSLYLTHQFNLRSSSIVAARLIQWGLPFLSEFPLRVAFSCAVGAVFWYLCERPFVNRPLNAKPFQVSREAAAA
jgi:peptidoglycan/LPS O-acetylase OafA/YrhL